jgi:hypothetical protein
MSRPVPRPDWRALAAELAAALERLDRAYVGDNLDPSTHSPRRPDWIAGPLARFRAARAADPPGPRGSIVFRKRRRHAPAAP